MDKRESITVSINGKKVKTYKKKRSNRSHDTQSSKIFDRHDHIVSDSENIPDTSHQNISNEPKHSFQYIKPLLIAVFSALTIGSLLGFMMLIMFKGLGDETPAQPTMPENNENNDADVQSGEDGQKEKDRLHVQNLQAYVLQAGVFSNNENAEKESETFQDAGYPTVTWERDGEYHLFVGISTTRQQGKDHAEQLEELDLEVFVKEWDTASSDLDLTEDESEWIHSFQTLWDDTIESVSSKNDLLMDQWSQLLDENVIQSEALHSFQDELKQLLANDEIKEPPFQQQFLLYTWYELEQLLKSNS